MKKKLLVAMMAIAGAFATTHAATYQSLLFKTTDPSVLLCVHMEDDMTLKVEDNAVKMECSSGTIEVPLSETTSWSFSTNGGSSDLWARIDDVTPDKETIDVTMTGDKIVISNLPDGAQVSVYSLDGMMVSTTAATAGTAEIHTASMMPGMYVLSFANQSLKIAVGL